MAASRLGRPRLAERRLRFVKAAFIGAAALCTALLVAGAGAIGSTATAAQPAAHGPTLRFNMSATDVDFTDPSLAYGTISWQLEYATALTLYTYPDAPAPEGSRLVPEAAAGFPVVSPDGKTYTITVKPGRFSDGRLATAANYAFAINRARDPQMQSPAAPMIADVDGVRVDGDKLVIRLTEPDGGLLGKLAMPFFQALPLDLPADPHGVVVYPSAGPYYFAARTVGRDITLRRNPYYSGSRPAYADEIDIAVNTNLDQSLQQVRSGEVDYDLGGLPSTAHADLGAEFGVNAANGRYHVSPLVETDYIALNTSRPPFSDVDLRKAFNYAVDRPALIAVRGAYAASPTDQILPPGMPGFRDAALYPLDGPDLQTARSLAGDRCGTVKLWTTTSAVGQGLADVARHDLEQIGCTVEIRLFQGFQLYVAAGQRGADFDAAVVGWNQDYPDPYDFLDVLLNGRSIRDTNGNNLAYFDDPGINAKLDQAKLLAGAERFAAYGDLDIEIMRDHAPWVPYDTRNEREFTAERLAGYVFQPANASADLNTFVVRPRDDTTPPTLTLPADMTLDAANGAAVTYAVTASDDTDTSPLLSCAPPSGSVFPIGITTVSCRATDAAGNSASGSFTVELTGVAPPPDTTPPTLTLPGDISVRATTADGATVQYTVSATDDVDPSPTVACAPPSGSRFPVGATTVRCTATDAAWNTTTGTFLVEVGRLPVINVSVSSDYVSASQFDAGATLTLTVRTSTGGAIVATAAKAANASGYAFFGRGADFSVDLVAGMEITVGDGATSKRLVVPPLAITSIDPAHDTVSGTAAPGMPVHVAVSTTSSTARTVTAAGSGAWSVDFSPFDVTYDAWVSAWVTDDDSDVVHVERTPPTVSVYLTGSVTARAFAPRVTLTLTIRGSAGGPVVATATKTADDGGWASFGLGTDFAVGLKPGMEITVDDGTTAKRLLLSPLAVTRVDPEHDTALGSAPPGARVQVTVYSSGTSAVRVVTAGADGAWSTDFGSFAVTYPASVTASIADDDGDTTLASKSSALIQAWLPNSISVSGFGPNATITLVLRETAGGRVLATASKGGGVDGAASFGRGTDLPVRLGPGMEVTVGDGVVTKRLEIPPLAITTVDVARNVVSGTAGPGTSVQVFANDGGYASQTVVAGADGAWSIDFSPYDVTSGTSLLARTIDEDGDEALRQQWPARLYAWLSSGYVAAGGFAPNATLTFTLRDGAGGIVATMTSTSDDNGSGYFSHALAPGMEITVGDGTTTKRLTIPPLSITLVDPDHDVIAGTAAPGSVVQLGIRYSSSASQSRQVTAGTDGAWSIALAPFDLARWMVVNAEVADDDGDLTEISRVPPPVQTTIDSGPSGPTNDPTPTFAFSADEPATFLCRLDYGTFDQCASPYTTRALADGAHTLDVYGVDPLGLVGPAASRSFTVDTRAPVTWILSGPSGATNDSTPTFALSADETAATFECRTDAGPFTPCTSPYTTAVLADGDHSVTVRATDRAGNVGSAVGRAFRVDTTPPVAAITSGPSGLTNDSTPTFALGADEVATFECRVDTAPFAACGTPYTIEAVADGPHTFDVRATDTAGNAGAAARRSFTVDTTPPVTTLTGGPARPTNDETPTFAFGADEWATFECRVDAAAFTACSSPSTAAVLPPGPHTFEVRATDRAGNLGHPASRAFAIQAVLDRLSLRFVSDTGARVTTWEGDVARTGDVAAITVGWMWDSITGAGELGPPSTAFSIDLHAVGVGRLMTGSVIATRGAERITLREFVTPFACSPDGTASTVSPVRATYFDGRNAVPGVVSLVVADAANAPS